MRCAIKSFKPPPLLQVDQQIRTEAVGLLTTANGIEMTIRSNYVVLAKDHTPMWQPLFKHDVGLLQLDDARSKWLTNHNAVFRDVIISVLSASRAAGKVGTFFIGGAMNKDRYTTKWQANYPYAPNLELLREMWTDISADIEKIMKEAEARPGFTGLTLKDLENIAKFFDYVKCE